MFKKRYINVTSIISNGCSCTVSGMKVVLLRRGENGALVNDEARVDSRI